MTTELLSAGPPTTLLEDVVYALPARLVFITSSAAIERSVDNSTWVALTGADTTGINAAGGWIRCTSGSCQVTLKAY